MSARPRSRAVVATLAGLALAALTATPLARTAHAEPADRWLGRDKALHFGASALLASGGYAAAAGLGTERRSLRVTVGASTALTIGLAKEILDRYTGGQPSRRDFAWDLVGTATGVGIAWLVDLLLR